MMRGLIAVAGLAVTGLLGLAMLAPPAQADSARPARAAHATLQPWPVTITIRTVPPLAGVRFIFDGKPLTTGRAGTVSHTERHNFRSHTLRLAGTKVARAGRRYAFVRWVGQRDPNQAFRPTVRGLPMRADYTVTAAFSVSCPVTPRLTDQHGRALEPARISQVTVRSDTGRPAVLYPSGTTWIQCARPVFRDSKLSSQLLRYSVTGVMMSGANLVHPGAQRFRPSLNPDPAIVGYVHDLTITARDALFGGGTGSAAVVTLPDHSVLRAAFGPGHTVTLHGLPQGGYLVSVEAGHAIVSAQAVRLSKDQTVDLRAVSPGDLVTLGGSVLVVAGGLPLLSGSRRRRLRGFFRLRFPRRRDTRAPA